MSNAKYFDIKHLSDEQRVAFHGALFAMAAVDGQVQREELDLIYETLDADDLTEEARRRLYAYAIDPPVLRDCLQALWDAPDPIRYGLMINLIELSIADYLVSDSEHEALAMAQQALRVSDEQRTAMEEYAEKMRYVRERGIDDDYATDAVKTAMSG